MNNLNTNWYCWLLTLKGLVIVSYLKSSIAEIPFDVEKRNNSGSKQPLGVIHFNHLAQTDSTSKVGQVAEVEAHQVLIVSKERDFTVSLENDLAIIIVQYLSYIWSDFPC